MSAPRVTASRRAGLVVARVEGEIDLANAGELGEALRERLSNEDHGLVLDLDGVAYVDSSGISLLYALVARLGERGQRVALVLPEDSTAREVLELVGLTGAVPTYTTAEAAAAAEAATAEPEPEAAPAPAPEAEAGERG